MTAETTLKVKWQLTQTAFDNLLASLCAEDRHTAGEKYLLLRRNLVRYFAGRGFPEAEDAAEEVLNRLARKLDRGETFENVNVYALGVARFVALELRQAPARQFTNELPEIAVEPLNHEVELGEQKLGCLEKCLRELSPANQKIIVDYYQGERGDKIQNRQKLADGLGIPPNALRNRAVRLRDKLETCICRCLNKQRF